jgi:hypothetical protein
MKDAEILLSFIKLDIFKRLERILDVLNDKDFWDYLPS